MLANRIRHVVEQVRPDLQGKIFDGSVLVETGFSSFDIVQLVLGLEQEFSINLIDNEITANAVSSVSSIASLLEDRFQIK